MASNKISGFVVAFSDVEIRIHVSDFGYCRTFECARSIFKGRINIGEELILHLGVKKDDKSGIEELEVKKLENDPKRSDIFSGTGVVTSVKPTKEEFEYILHCSGSLLGYDCKAFSETKIPVSSEVEFDIKSKSFGSVSVIEGENLSLLSEELKSSFVLD